MTKIIGHTVTFHGDPMGVVVSDDVKPVGWSATNQRVITLDNGVALRDVTAPEARAKGWNVVPPANAASSPDVPASVGPDTNTPARPANPASPLFKPWNAYPIGSKAHAVGGGHWYRTESGWKWNGPEGCGSTFPTPGADAYVVTEPGAEIVSQI